MNYRIETKKAFRIVGISEPLHKEIEKTLKLYLKCGRTLRSRIRLEPWQT